MVAGKKYHAPAEGGALLTVLPIYEATETDFEVEYSITNNPPPKKSGNIIMIIGISVAVFASLIIVCVVIKIRKNKKDNSV